MEPRDDEQLTVFGIDYEDKFKDTHEYLAVQDRPPGKSCVDIPATGLKDAGGLAQPEPYEC